MMNSESKETIAVLSSDGASQAHYKCLFEKYFITASFPSISEFLLSLHPRGRSPLALIIDTDTEIPNLEAIEKISLPVFLLCTSDDLDELRQAFRLGIDQIRVKPVNENELIASLEKLSRQTPAPAQTIQCNPISRKVSACGKTSVELTSRELQIFLSFQVAKDHKLRRNKIISQVWGNVQVGNKTLDVHLFNLRKKLAKIGLEILFSAPDIFTLSVAIKPQ